MPFDELLSRAAFLSLSTAGKGLYFVLHGLADDEGRLVAEPEALRIQGGLLDLSPGEVAGLLAELRLAGLLALYGDRLAFLPGWPACMTGRRFVARSRLPLPPADMLDAAPDYRRWLAGISLRCRPGEAIGERSSDPKREPRHRCLWPNEWPREHKKWRELPVSAVNRQESAESGGQVRIGAESGGKWRGPTPTPGLTVARARRGAAPTAKRSDATAPEQALPDPGNLALPPRASDGATLINADFRTCATDVGAPPAAAAPAARGRATVDQGGIELHLDGRAIALLRSMVPGRGKQTWHHGTESTLDPDGLERIERARLKIVGAGHSPASVQELLGMGHGQIRAKNIDALSAAAEILAMRAAEDAALRAGASAVST